MNLIKSLMGRRQFLVAAGMASTAALAWKKLAGVVDPVFQPSVAGAAGRSGAAGVKGASNRYSHLLSPIRIGNVVLKNRMIHTVGSPPHFLQGPETFPSDQIRSFYANVARGAAIVLCPTAIPSGAAGGGAPEGGGGMMPGGASPEEEAAMAAMMGAGGGDSVHMTQYDTTDTRVINYIDQVIESVHYMGSLVAGMGGLQGSKDIVEQAKYVEDLGIDVVQMSPADYRDKNAMRSTVEEMQAIKSATNLLISMRFHVVHPLLPREQEVREDHLSLDEAIEFAKVFDGSVDILQFRLAAGVHSHPDGYCQDEGEPGSLYCSQAIKESGLKHTLLAPNGGFQNLDENEEAIASGKCDMIMMSRAWHVDYEYGQKAYEGRGEDVVPCVMCNRCHGGGRSGPWSCKCTVNPKLGLESAAKIFPAPVVSKRVAVIGGGPAGMKAALVAAERGHRVTLYEKDAALGGLIRHTDFDSYKWAYRRFKDYLVRQVEKAGIEVLLRTEATPGMIKERGYDAVVVALGAEPIASKISGADGKNVWTNIVDVYGREKELGKDVVVVGGGEWSVQTGVYLAGAGHNVTILAAGVSGGFGGEKALFQSGGPHQGGGLNLKWQNMKNFTPVTDAITTRISEGKVTYKDAKGREQTVQADSVVIYSGLKARQDEALKFYGSAKNGFYIAGDCTNKCGDVQKSLRSAYLVASQI